MQRVGIVLSLSLFVLSCALKGEQDHRDFDMDWTVRLENIPEGANEAAIWIALPQELPEQEVSDLRVTTDHEWEIVADTEFGNKVVRVVVKNPSESLSIGLTAKVRRYPVTAPVPASLNHKERDLYLREEALVSLSSRIRELSEKVGNDHRARYDYVRAVMEYDKTAPGWGNGDSERACDVGKGNCTDYHSLFMSLARAQGVPAVFEMGYPTKVEGEIDREGGYHCWAWFYRDGAWVVVDISEADRYPEKTEFFYGHLDPNRITFSRGRDVVLPGMKGKPLNYLPSGAYAEVDGFPFENISRKLTYTVEVPSDSE